MRGRASGLLALVTVLGASLLGVVSTPPPSSAAPAASETVPTIPTDAAGRVAVIVDLDVAFTPEGELAPAAARAQRARVASARERVERFFDGRARVLRRYGAVPAVAMTVAPGEVDSLRRHPDVQHVEPVVPLRPAVTWNQTIIGAPTAWAAGSDGTGRAVAVIDSGVESGHSQFGGRVVGQACFSTGNHGADPPGDCPGGGTTAFGAGAGEPCDFDGDCVHGTHVAGIVAGATTGVAPGASLVSVQVLGRDTVSLGCSEESPCVYATTSDIVAALDWLYVNHDDWPLASVNISLGGGASTDPCDAFFPAITDAIDNLRSIGVATVVAAGNDFAFFGAALAIPACISTAISVGATNSGDAVASFSQTGDRLSLLAPGVNIVSALPGNALGSLSGTSMAAPHVAGAWALLDQESPHASVANVLRTLQRTGAKVVDQRVSPSLSFRRIDVGAAEAAMREQPSDFNGDGFADLAIGVPHEDVGAASDAGSVNVLYGSAAGPATAGNQVLAQGSGGLPDAPEAGDRFGSALAWGDFDADGFDDLAIGVPGEDEGAVSGAGILQVVYGSATGLDPARSAQFGENTTGVPGTAEAGDRFGEALAAGDADGDGRDDLAVGIPRENAGSLADAGRVVLLFGTGSGLGASGSKLVSPPAGEDQAGSRFAAALTMGDFDGRGRRGLAAGAPGRTVSSHSGAGAVYTFRWNAQRSALATQRFTQDFLSMQDATEAGDGFASALAAGDANGDGYDDLAIGVPFEDVLSAKDAGAVQIVFGGRSANGLGHAGNQRFRQGAGDVADLIENGDRFASALAFADTDGDGMSDLVVGVGRENVLAAVDAGVVHVLFGWWTGVTGDDSLLVHKGAGDVPGVATAGDRFGDRLGALDADGSATDDVVVGAPGTDDALVDVGAVHVLPGGATGPVTASSTVWEQTGGVDGGLEAGDGFGSALPH